MKEELLKRQYLSYEPEEVNKNMWSYRRSS